MKGLPSKKPLPGPGFHTPGKEIPKEAIKSGMSCRKNKEDNYLLFPTIQEVEDITVWKLFAADPTETEESPFSELQSSDKDLSFSPPKVPKCHSALGR